MYPFGTHFAFHSLDGVGYFKTTPFDMGHAFVRSAAGVLTVLDVPGPGTQNNQGATTRRINSAGTIMGNYSDANNATHGYLRSPDGTFTTIDAPNAFQGANSPGTFITHINARGAIVGYYFDAQGTRHGFVRE